MIRQELCPLCYNTIHKANDCAKRSVNDPSSNEFLSLSLNVFERRNSCPVQSCHPLPTSKAAELPKEITSLAGLTGKCAACYVLTYGVGWGNTCLASACEGCIWCQMSCL